MSSATPGGRRVVLVTGGGGGIGAAVAEELGRRGDHVVTVDPLVSVDGTETLPDPEETTAGRIVAAGGSAEASHASVTDRDAMQDLAARLMAEHGRIDGVVNVAGITRPTGVASGTDEDWQAVLAVHLDGYRTVLEAVLPHMAAAGHGRIVGVTSGSGWRAADAGAYSAAKRAVAALTWQLGAIAPAGVAVNAISPIAMTRMVTAALARAGGGAAPAAQPGGSAKTGGLSLGGMPAPAELAPLTAHLAGAACTLRGRILFAGGSEAALVEPPRLLEVVRTDAAASLEAALAIAESAFVAAEAAQATGGGANPRYAEALAATPEAATDTWRVLVVAERPELVHATTSRLEAAGANVTVGRELADLAPDLDAVIVEAAATPVQGDGWEAVLASHAGLAGELHDDAAWLRAAAEVAATGDRPMRVVTLVDAADAGGASRAQAIAQLSRATRRATQDRVAAFAVALEDAADTEVASALAARLATTADPTLAGAELAVGQGWLGLRSHPRPAASIVLGAGAIPPWFDGAIQDAGR